MSRPGSGRRLQRQEEELVRRRNAEHDRLLLWNGVTQYYSDWDVHATKYHTWASPDYYQASQESRQRQEEVSRKAENLNQRRERLKALLTQEQEQLTRELQEFRLRSSRDTTYRNDAVVTLLELRRREEEARRREAELRLYQQWQRGQPVLQEYERQRQHQFVKQAWVSQVKEQQELRAKREQEEIEAMKERDQKLQEQLRKEEEERAARQARAMELQEDLQRQISELKEKENEAEALKQEESKSLQLQLEMQHLQQNWRKAMERRKNLEIKTFIQHQHHLKLRRRAKEVLEALSDDQRMLETVLAAELVDIKKEKERKITARLEMLKAKRQLEEAAERMQQEISDLEFMFDEEARLMWDKKEAKWKAEEEAREELLNNVLLEVQEQIKEKIEQNLKEQRKVLEHRESILAEVEASNLELKKEKERLELLKKKYRCDISNQVLEKQSQKLEQLQLQQLAVQQEKELAMEEEKRLLDELRRLEQTVYKAPNYHRRQCLW